MDQSWNDIAHLHRRAGFGSRPGEIAAGVEAGYDAEVARLCAFGPDPAGDAIPVPTYDTAALVAALRGDDAAKKKARQQLRKEAGATMLWWLRRMVATDQPLAEKLTWFWHGHFATSLQKVRLSALMHRQNDGQRRLGHGDFEALVRSMVVDPAMLIWLDGNKNQKGRPNENFGREMLELFVLGHGMEGAQPYTEDDVEAAARAFTGIRLDRADGTVAVRPRLHDAGPKTFLGQTGAWGSDDIVRIATHHRACAPFVVSRLWSRLARPADPDDPVVASLAPAFAEDLDISSLCRALFAHPEFRAAATRTGLVKQPVEWLAGSCRALGLDPADPRVLPLLRALGQLPFVPPSVGGWPANEAWLTTGAALERLRLAGLLVASLPANPLAKVSTANRPEAAAELLGLGAWTPTTAAALTASAAAPGELLTLALVAPEHLLA